MKVKRSNLRRVSRILNYVTDHDLFDYYYQGRTREQEIFCSWSMVQCLANLTFNIN